MGTEHKTTLPTTAQRQDSIMCFLYLLPFLGLMWLSLCPVSAFFLAMIACIAALMHDTSGPSCSSRRSRCSRHGQSACVLDEFFLFAPFCEPQSATKRSRAAKLELAEKDDAYEVKLETPGVKKADLSIDLTGKKLTVKGKPDDTSSEHPAPKKTKEKTKEGDAWEWDMASEPSSPGSSPEASEPLQAKAKASSKAPSRHVLHQERNFDSFERVVHLPNNASEDAAAVRASYVDGVLSI